MRSLLRSLLISFCCLSAVSAHAAYSSWTEITDEMQEILDESFRIYETGESRKAIDTVNVAYFQYYEKLGVERNVMTYISGNDAAACEYKFAAVKKLMAAKAELEEVRSELQGLKDMLHAQGQQLDDENDGEGEGGSFWGGFVASLLIILREGIEAMIIVAAILAYLVKLGHPEKRKPVIQGAALAVVASFAMAWIIDSLAGASGQNQEIVEGVTMLVAVVVLFYVSNFMMSKADAAAWMSYLKGKVTGSLARGSMYALVFTAFLAVFREGAEVILFYEAMFMSGSDATGVWTGFGIGCLLLVFVYLFIHVLSVRLPLKTFFVGTSILMYIMCISFVGSAIKEFQEGDLVGVTQVPFVPTIDVLGIYPTVETLVPQGIMLVLCLLTIWLAVHRWKKARAELEAEAQANPNAVINVEF